MRDQNKSKEQLIDELAELRQQIVELEASEAEPKQVDEVLDDGPNRSAFNLNILLLATFVVMLLGIIAMLSQIGKRSLSYMLSNTIFLIFAALILAVCYYLSRKGYVRAGSIIFTVMMTLACGGAIVVGGTRGALPVILIIPVVSASVTLGTTTSLALAAWSVAALVIVALLERNSIIQVAYPAPEVMALLNMFDVGFGLFFVTLGIWLAGYSLRQSLERALKEIVDRRRAEEALRESEIRFRQLAETVQDAFWLGTPGTGEDRQILYVSPAFEKMFGIKAEEIRKSENAWLEVLYEEDRERVLGLLEGFLQSQNDYNVEYRIVCPDGSVRWIWARGFAIRDKTGEIYRIAGLAQDITERKRTEEEIRQRVFEQEALREAMLVLTTTLDRSEVIGRILAQLQEVVPYDAASVQLLREGYLEIVGGRGFPNLEELLGVTFDPQREDNPNREVVRTQAPFIVDDAPTVYKEFLRDPHAPAGIRSWLGVPMLVGERLIGMIALDKSDPGFYTQEHARLVEAFAAQAAIAVENAQLFEQAQREIAERKRAEAALREQAHALRESERKHRSFLENFDGIAYQVSHLTFRPFFFYGMVEEITGYTSDDFTAGRVAWDKLIHPDDLDEVRKMGESLRDIPGYVADSEYRIWTRDRQMRWVRDIGRAIRMGDGQTRFLQGAVYDITDRKRVADLLRAQRDLALQLGATIGLDETLRLCVEAAIHNTEMDAGGVYLVDETSGNLDLRYSTGLSPDFIALTSHYDADAPNTRLVMEGRPIYINYQELDVPMDEIRRKEGLGGMAILPILHEGRVIACLNIASHSLSEIHVATRDTLETIAAQIGSAIAHSKAQEALRQSEERLRRVVENMPVMMDALDEDSNIIVWNRECERVTGYSAAEMVGNLQSLEMLYPDAAYREQMVAEVIGLGLNYRNKEWTLTCKDGAKKTISWSCVSSQFPIPGWYSWAIGVDVTARKQAEEERERLLVQIQEQARRMQQIMDTVPEGVLLLRANGQVILTNPVAGRHLDILAGARTGDTLTHLGNRPLAEFLTSPPKGLWHEITMGDRVFELVARPMENGPEPEDWVLVINDVTQQREIQQHTQHQERLASVGQLAAGIAHDFNNIMATIVLYAQMTARMEELPTVVRERMGTINQQAEHATKLIQQILDFSRRAVLERRPLDMVPLLKEHVKLLERTLPENIEIELIYELDEYAAPLTVHADPTRMQQMVTNLAVNARDAMPNGGILRIELDHVEVRPGESPLLPEMEAGEWIKVTVSDTGTGIPPDVLPHIFEPFFTTRAPLGSGLGLAQVHGIVGQHGGRINVDTRLGEGTIFTIYLPALSVSEKPSTVLPKSSSPLSGQGQTVLVVEDDAVLRKVLVESLSTLNYQVLGATNGQEALVMLEQHGDEIDLLLSDMVMPVMGGKALLYALRERGLTIPVVMLTGHPLKKEMEELRAQGLTDWLRKPPELEELAEVITRALDTD